MKTIRNDIFKYVKKKYGIEPDFPFKSPKAAIEYPVLRHEDNRKLFALFMDVSRDKLGVDMANPTKDGREGTLGYGEERVDIVNVKLEDPLLVDILIQQDGYFRGYHISRGNWISILLDGTVPLKEIYPLIDESFLVTASRQKKQKARPPKEWIVPANPKYYDIEHAFDEAKEIDWKQGACIKTGDTVFMCVAAPVSAILFKCKVTETDISCHYQVWNLTIKALMKVKLLKRYKPERFTFDVLKDQYGIFAVRGPRSVPHSLSEALKK